MKMFVQSVSAEAVIIQFELICADEDNNHGVPSLFPCD